MNTEAIIKRVEALLEKKLHVKKEPSEEMKSCLSLYSIVLNCVMSTMPDYEGSLSIEILMKSAEYKYIESVGGIGAICSRIRNKVIESSTSEQEKQECFELINSAKRLYNEHLAKG